MSKDIIERLRNARSREDSFTCGEAADTIESLAAEVTMLWEALNYYANGVFETKTFTYFDMSPYDRAIFTYEVADRAVAKAVLSLSTNHAAILAQRDARTLRKAAERFKSAQEDQSPALVTVKLRSMAAELEANAGKESGK